ncbi:MAG: RimK/LysX family protein [Brumimicrobium sp.]
MKKQRPIIGKDDIANFPKFGLTNVRVKIDSGAYTSTIHCSKIEETNEGLLVVFLDRKEKGYNGEKIIFPTFQQKKVRSSSGESQERYIIKGNIELFGKKYNTEFTLSRRNLMRYPVLLGRKLLNKRFLIDTSLSNQSIKLKNSEK